VSKNSSGIVAPLKASQIVLRRAELMCEGQGTVA